MKNFNRRFGLLGWLLLISLVAMGAKIGENILRVGDLTGSDVEIQMGSGRVKWDDSESALQFSNDSGSSFKKIGSGSGGGGGGVNFIEDNPDAESSTNNWTYSGAGTFATTNTAGDVFLGANSFSVDFSANAETLTSDQTTVPDGFLDGACEANFQYKGGTDDVVDLEVIDSSLAVLATVTLKASTDFIKKSLYFLCPSTQGETIAFRLKVNQASNPAAIIFDQVHLGSNTGLTDTLVKEPDSMIDVRDATGYGSTDDKILCFGTVIQSTGSAITRATNATNCDTYTINEDGVYYISFTGDMNAAGQHFGISLNSSQLTTALASITDADRLAINNKSGASAPAPATWSGILSAGDVIRAHTNGGTVGSNNRERFTIAKIGDVASNAVGFRPEQASFVMEFEFKGGEWVGLTTDTSGVYNEFGEVSTGEIVSHLGPAPRILCDDSTSPEGLTCNTSGVDEEYGFEFDVNIKGDYEVCWGAGHSFSTSGGASRVALRIDKVNALTRATTEAGANAGAKRVDSGFFGNRMDLCETFTLGVGAHAFMLKYDLDVITGSVGNNKIYGQDVGGRNSYVRVQLKNHLVSRPIIQNMVTNSEDKGVRVESCIIDNNGTATINNVGQTCAWVDSVNRSGTGVVEVTIGTSIFSQIPVCGGTIRGTTTTENGLISVVEDTATTTFLEVSTRNNSGGSTDHDFTLTCVGKF